MKLKKIVLALVLSSLVLVGCSDTEEQDPSLTDGSQNDVIGINDASTRPLGSDSSMNGSDMGGSGMMGGRRGGMGNTEDVSGGLGPEFSNPNSPLSKRVIYFKLNSSEIQDDFIPVLNAHAQYLVANPSQQIVLEGHADAQGSREYNVALGERRAKSVANIMKTQGVGEGQVQVVSYGEEKPAAFGNDESAWQMNRRTEIVYQGR